MEGPAENMIAPPGWANSITPGFAGVESNSKGVVW